MSIQQISGRVAVTATSSTKATKANLEKLAREITVDPIKLVRTPVLDAFEKRSYMESEAFWHDAQNFANYARGQYLTEGGRAFQESGRGYGEKVIYRDLDVERGFRKYLEPSNTNITYYEKDLHTGEIHALDLSNGQPDFYFAPNYETVHYDKQTGNPLCKSYIDKDQKLSDIYAEDGQTVKATIVERFMNMILKIVPQEGNGQDRYLYKNAKRLGESEHIEGKLMKFEHLDENGIKTKKITYYDTAEQPREIINLNDEGTFTVQKFDREGNLLSTQIRQTI